MDEMQIRTLEDIEQFLDEPTGAQLKLQGSKDDVYKWIEHTLVRFRYPWLGKLQKGLVLRYIRQLSDYTRQHVTKLVKQQRKTGYIRRKPRTNNGFATSEWGTRPPARGFRSPRRYGWQERRVSHQFRG